MKIHKCFLLLSLSLSAFSVGAKVASMPKSPSLDKETELAVAQLKEQQVEKQLTENNDLLKKCKEKEPDQIETCLKNTITQMDDSKVEQLAQNMDLNSYDLEASKNATTIRDYLSERIENAMRGRPKGDKGKEISIKDLKFVDHAYYAKIYRSQIGKNILLEISDYCLTNLGLKSDQKAIVNQCMSPSANAVNTDTSEPVYPSCLSGGEKFSRASITSDGNGGYTDIPSKISDTTVSSDFWKSKVYEYRLCDKRKDVGASDGVCKDDGDSGITATKFKTTKILNAIKEVEFSFGGEYLKDKVNFCSSVVIQNMCEKYRCTHVYSKKTDISGEKAKACNDNLGIIISDDPPNGGVPAVENTRIDDVSGIKACGLVSRLKEYRRVIAALDKVEQFNKDNKGKARGLSLGDSKAFKGAYGNTDKNGEKTVEQITTISSKEFSDINLVDEKELEELNKKCFDASGVFNTSDDDCKKLAGNELGDEQAANINAEMTAETELYLKRIKDLADQGEEESINEYLKKHGLEKYIGKNLDTKELGDIISEQYKSERAALKNRMMEKFNKLTKSPSTTSSSTAPTENEDLSLVAEETISKMENEQERMETMFQYNNIITSYMEAKLGDGKDAETQSLTYQREIEMGHFKEKATEDEQERAQKYEGYFDDETSKSTSSGTDAQSLSVDLNFIDGLLGNRVEE